MEKESSKEKPIQEKGNGSNSDYKLYNYKLFYTPDDLGDISKYYREKNLGIPESFLSQEVHIELCIKIRFGL